MPDGGAKRSVRKSGVTGTHTDYTCPATQAKRKEVRGDWYPHRLHLPRDPSEAYVSLGRWGRAKRSVYKSGAMGPG